MKDHTVASQLCDFERGRGQFVTETFEEAWRSGEFARRVNGPTIGGLGEMIGCPEDVDDGFFLL